MDMTVFVGDTATANVSFYLSERISNPTPSGTADRKQSSAEGIKAELQQPVGP